MRNLEGPLRNICTSLFDIQKPFTFRLLPLTSFIVAGISLKVKGERLLKMVKAKANSEFRLRNIGTSLFKIQYSLFDIQKPFTFRLLPFTLFIIAGIGIAIIT
jgi:hypothetical protein